MNPVHVLLSAFLLLITFISHLPLILFSVMQQPNSGPCCLVFEVSRSYTIRHTHTHSVGFLWTSDRLVAEAGTYTTHNKHKRQISKSSAGFIPAKPAIERPQTYNLDRTAIDVDASSSSQERMFLTTKQTFCFCVVISPF